MDASSKVFEWPLNELACSQIIHSLPNQTCVQSLAWNLYRNHVSSSKYYLPVLLFPIIMNWRKLNRHRLWAMVNNYIQTASIGATINALTLHLMCIFRRLHGRYIKWYTPFLSCFLAAQILWRAPPKLLQLYTTGIIHAGVEGLLRQLDLRLVHSQPAQTLIFMCCSLAVLWQQQAQHYKGFWFIRPQPLTEDFQKWSWWKRITKSLPEIGNYLGIGLALDLFGALMRRNLKQMQLKSTRFLLGYISIYKATQCILAGHMKITHISLLAAFVSGLAFGFAAQLPLTLMSFSLVVASQVLWERLCRLDSRHNKLLYAIQLIPWAKLLIPPNLAYLVHSLIFQRSVVNRLAKSFIDSTCDNNSQRIYEMVILPTEKILTMVDKIPIKSFI